MSTDHIFSAFSSSRDTAFSANTAKRVADASVETVPLEELVKNMRKMFIGQYEEVTEARFGEVVDIISDQKGQADDRFSSLLTSVNHVKEQQLDFDISMGTVNERISKVQENLAHEMKNMMQYCDDMALKIRQEAEFRTNSAFARLENAFGDFSVQSRNGLKSLSDTIGAHITEDDKRWEHHKSSSHTALEQRIAQWRAEIDDARREDMSHVASSMVDIGQRLMSR